MEQMVLHVDLNERRATPMPESVQANVQILARAISFAGDEGLGLSNPQAHHSDYGDNSDHQR